MNRSTEKISFTEESGFLHQCLSERDEILRHKWLESEKNGSDIGYDRAVLDWVRRHRKPYRHREEEPTA